MNKPKDQIVKILIFGYKEFSQLMGTVLPEFSNQAEFRVVDAIVASVSEIQEHINDFQPDAVISAGANAAYLQANLNRPVLSIEVTESDIVDAITRAAKISKNILLISFDTNHRILPYLEDNLGVSIQHMHYQTSEEAREAFHLATKHEDLAVVGASLICSLANQYHVPSFLFYSSNSSRQVISKAIKRASIYQLNKNNQTISDWLLHSSSSPILLLNRNTQEIQANQAAKEQLDLQSLDINHELFHSNDTADQHTVEHYCAANGIDWICNRHSLILSGMPHDIYQFSRSSASGQVVTTEDRIDSKLIYESDALADVMQQVKAYAVSPSNILITGESGTGKELIARAIHEHSSYSAGKFVGLNCSAIPTELFEGELFGHMDGAFTGSRRGGRKGLFEEANKGALFLDEITELTLEQQAKLLRILQERVLRRLGSNKEVALDLKLIAASNKPLADLVEQGLFREDLYYRLNVFNISVPPLRMRREDIVCIAQGKLKQLLYKYDIHYESDDVLSPIKSALSNYNWPGNVRELENVLERLVASLSVIKDLSSIESLLRKISPELFIESEIHQTHGMARKKELELVADSMLRFNGNKQKVAEYLGMSQTTLWRRLKQLNHL